VELLASNLSVQQFLLHIQHQPPKTLNALATVKRNKKQNRKDRKNAPGQPEKTGEQGVNQPGTVQKDVPKPSAPQASSSKQPEQSNVAVTKNIIKAAIQDKPAATGSRGKAKIEQQRGNIRAGAPIQPTSSPLAA